MRYLRLFVMTVMLLSVAIACKQSKIVDLYGVIKLVYFLPDETGNRYSVNTREISFRKGSSFNRRDSEALFDGLEIDKFAINKLFLSVKGEDLVKSGDYSTPGSMPDDKVGTILYRTRSSLRELDLTSYFFAESTNLYAYYDPVHVAGIDFKGDYSQDPVTSMTSFNIDALISPGNAADKNVSWTCRSRTDYPGDDEDVLKIINRTTRGLSLQVVAMVPGTCTVEVVSDDGGYSRTCDITVVPFAVPVPIELGGDSSLFLDHNSVNLPADYKTGFVWESLDKSKVDFQNPDLPYKATGFEATGEDGVVIRGVRKDADGKTDLVAYLRLRVVEPPAGD